MSCVFGEDSARRPSVGSALGRRSKCWCTTKPSLATALVFCLGDLAEWMIWLSNKQAFALRLRPVLPTHTQMAGESEGISLRSGSTALQTRHIDPLLNRCWANVVYGGPTLVQHWVEV